jgi:low temperature requirement protein LtrA
VIRGVAAANAEEQLSALTLVAAALGLAIGFAMWWLYYDFVARRPTKPSFSAALIWVYLHIVAMAAIVLVGVGIAGAIAETPTISGMFSTLLFAGLGAMLISFGLLEFTLDRDDDEPTSPRLSPGLKFGFGLPLVVVGVLQPAMPTALAFGVCLAVLAVQAGYGALVYYRR